MVWAYPRIDSLIPLSFGPFVRPITFSVIHNKSYATLPCFQGFQAACMVEGVKKQFTAPAPVMVDDGKRLSEGAVIPRQPHPYTISILRFFSKFVTSLLVVVRAITSLFPPRQAAVGSAIPCNGGELPKGSGWGRFWLESLGVPPPVGRFFISGAMA